jgi:GTP-binding protein
MDLEDALEWIDEDELVEVTPDMIRCRKKELRQSFRPRGPRSQRAGGPPVPSVP